MLQILKIIFIFFLVLYALSKIMDGMNSKYKNNKYKNNKDKIINLVEIVVSIALTFTIFKI